MILPSGLLVKSSHHAKGITHTSLSRKQVSDFHILVTLFLRAAHTKLLLYLTPWSHLHTHTLSVMRPKSVTCTPSQLTFSSAFSTAAAVTLFICVRGGKLIVSGQCCQDKQSPSCACTFDSVYVCKAPSNNRRRDIISQHFLCTVQLVSLMLLRFI